MASMTRDNKPSSKETLSAGAKYDEAALLKTLREVFPHGHKDFNPMTLKEMKLHSEKNYDYAAGGDPLGNFTRVAAILGQYKGLSLSDPVVIAIVYAMKQIDACLWMLSEKREGKIEDVNSRLGDVSVYVKLAMILHSNITGIPCEAEMPIETWDANEPATMTEHECYKGWSDGSTVECHRATAQRYHSGELQHDCEGKIVDGQAADCKRAVGSERRYV